MVEYYALDAVGSVRVVFDQSGTIMSRRDYEPFGAPVVQITLDPKIYAGLFHDDESGLEYAQARMYRATTGRFLSVDPVYAGLFEPQAWNRYTYALNSPLTYTDPDGLQAALVIRRHYSFPYDVIPARFNNGGAGGGPGRASLAGIGSSSAGRGRGGTGPRDSGSQKPPPATPPRPVPHRPEPPGDPETPNPGPEKENDCQNYVDSLTGDVRAGGPWGLSQVGMSMQGRALLDGYRGIGPRTVTGFQDRLVGSGQGRGVYRHIDFVSGGVISGSGFVGPFIAVDMFQATFSSTPERRAESWVELRNDLAAIRVGLEILRGAASANYSRMRQQITRSLCR